MIKSSTPQPNLAGPLQPPPLLFPQQHLKTQSAPPPIPGGFGGPPPTAPPPRPVTPPAPAPAPRPATPPTWTTNPWGKFNELTRPLTGSPYDAITKYTENVPPLSAYTHHLGSFQEPADAALRLIQKGIKGNPDLFPSLFGMTGELGKGLLSTPLGLPGVVALNGMLRGGESAAAAKTFLVDPLAKKLGVS